MTVTVYPTGTTIYEPKKCWNGYTLISNCGPDAYLVDMNGNVVNVWKGIGGFPNKMLPGGYLMGSTGGRNNKYGYQDRLDLVQVDWDGKPVWKFNNTDFISDPGEQPQWMARQHHDYQREGNPVGYYVPGMEPLVDRGSTVMLCHKNVTKPEISDKLLLDDVIIEVDWQGHITWEWKCSDHFEELGFSKRAKKVIARNPNMLNIGEGFGDWMHINSLSRIGPNKWFDTGDTRFHPDNLIWSSRQSNILAIVDRKTGQIVWKMGPDYNVKPLKKLGYIIGPHHAHIIPRGLSGEGNLMVFDNGGWAGYGAPNPGSANGFNNAIRASSRVLELNPLTSEIVWEYTAGKAGFNVPANEHKFYSSLVSSAQRLPNGNTLITEGVDGRVFEVTKEHELVWEYVYPDFRQTYSNHIYRADRLPYEWIPQVERPIEKAVHPPDNGKFRVPRSKTGKTGNITEIETDSDGGSDTQWCVLLKDAKN